MGPDRVEAVVILPILISPGQPPRTIFVTQHRPPVDAITVELPAGLIDPGETPEEAALRELREETGFVGSKARRIWNLMANVPDMTADTMRFIVGRI